MNILVDVSAGRAIADALIALGHNIAFVSDRDPKMPDTDILTWAVAVHRLVVTMDKDFGELVYRSGQTHTGVLLLRLETARAPERVRVVSEIFTQMSTNSLLISRSTKTADCEFADPHKHKRWRNSDAHPLEWLAMEITWRDVHAANSVDPW